MKRAGTISLLAAGMVLTIPVWADPPATAAGDNPYGPLVARNVFGLNPPTPPPPPGPDTPPPKITPNGIMTIFGHLQALFKAVDAPPGQAAKEKSYILAVGQREDDIEIVKIDDKANIITFNNHGTIQDLPLVPGAANTGATPSLGAPPGGIPLPMGAPINRFGNPMMRRPSPPFGGAAANPAMNPANNNNPAILGAGPAYMGNPNNQGNALSPDDIMALTAAQHSKAIQENNPAAPLFPPTRYDHEAGIPDMPPPP